MGNGCYLRQRIEEGRSLYLRALEPHRRLGDRREHGRVLGNLAMLVEDQTAPEEALDLHRADRASLTYVLASEASLLEELGRSEDARARYAEALDAARETKNALVEGIVVGAQATQVLETAAE